MKINRGLWSEQQREGMRKRRRLREKIEKDREGRERNMRDNVAGGFARHRPWTG